MKLRLHNDSLRLRLSQSEVTELSQTGRVENRLSFSPGPALTYAIETAPVAEVMATFEGNRLSVVLPSAVARHWIETEEIGVESSGSTPRVLVEKDFQCLHRASEEDADGFPNPLAQR